MRHNRIVIGVDFSTASLNAVRWVATRFAPHAELYLAHVIARPHSPAFLNEYLNHAPAGETDEPTLYPGLCGFADLAGASRAEVMVRRGQPAIELAALAHEIGADLICVGRSSRRRGTARFGATTPQRLLERTDRPVLLVPNDTRDHPTALLAPVSDGDEAQEVLRSTAALAYAWDAKVDVLHAVDAGLVAATASDTRVGSETLRELAEGWLARRVADVSLLDGRTRTISHLGDAAEAIVTHATRARCDLIVIGRRVGSSEGSNHTGCIGSTTRLITWATPCPVLVLGAPAVTLGHGGSDVVRRARRWGEVSATRTHRDGRPVRRGPVVRPDGDDAA